MDRLKEPSTWAGIGSMFATLANFLPGYFGIGAGAVAAAAGFMAVKLRERGA